MEKYVINSSKSPSQLWRGKVMVKKRDATKKDFYTRNLFVSVPERRQVEEGDRPLELVL